MQRALIFFLLLASSAFGAEAPKGEPPATMEVLFLRLSNIEKDLQIIELARPALEKARAELIAEIEKRKKEEEKKPAK